MSQQAQEARKAFGVRLRELRLDAGLTGLQLAEASGIRNTAISRIEHGRQNPTEEQIRDWAIACGVARLIPELTAVHREIEQVWVESLRELRAGMVHVQSRSTPLYEGTGLLRVYEPAIVPGILQIRPYTVAVLTTAARRMGLPLDDVEPGADARLVRQKLITSPTGRNTYSFVLEFAALITGFGDVKTMNTQFDFLRRVATLPHVAFGIIPPMSDRPIRAGEGFYLFDEHLVRSEMWTGGYRTRRPDEISQYVRLFTALRELAVYSRDAIALIELARSLLQIRENS